MSAKRTQSSKSNSKYERVFDPAPESDYFTSPPPELILRGPSLLRRSDRDSSNNDGYQLADITPPPPTELPRRDTYQSVPESTPLRSDTADSLPEKPAPSEISTAICRGDHADEASSQSNGAVAAPSYQDSVTSKASRASISPTLQRRTSTRRLFIRATQPIQPKRISAIGIRGERSSSAASRNGFSPLSSAAP